MVQTGTHVYFLHIPHTLHHTSSVTRLPHHLSQDCQVGEVHTMSWSLHIWQLNYKLLDCLALSVAGCHLWRWTDRHTEGPLSGSDCWQVCDTPCDARSTSDLILIWVLCKTCVIFSTRVRSIRYWLHLQQTKGFYSNVSHLLL